MINCIIFDCDGTLVDSEYLCNLALEIKLKEFDINESANEMMLQFRGSKLSTIIEALELKHKLILDESFVSSYRIVVKQLFEKHLKPIDGIFDTLNKLTIPICVASSGPLNKITQSLSITRLLHFFKNTIFSSYEIDSWKPEPGLFLHAAKKMGFEPNQCAVIEDSKVGINAAITAGMYPIYFNPLGLNNLGVCNIKHMSELHNVIKNI